SATTAELIGIEPSRIDPIELFPAVLASCFGFGNEHWQIGVHKQRCTGTSQLGFQFADLGEQSLCVVKIVHRHKEYVTGVNRGIQHGLVSSGKGHNRLTLRRTRCNSWAFDAEPLANKIYVVQLVSIDETSGGNVTNLRVIFPGVP